jgi:hypothetical protein
MERTGGANRNLFMDAKEYYYTQFKTDFNGFWSKALRGSSYLRFTSFLKGGVGDALEDIEREHIVYFLSAIGFTISLEKAMRTNFKNAYLEFKKTTAYPVMDIGWSRDNPWILLGASVRKDRHLTELEVKREFAEFAEFFAKDIEAYFNNQFTAVDWVDVRNAMARDAGAIEDEHGRIFREALTRLA